MRSKGNNTEKGAAAVELALVTTFILVPLLFGTIEIGLLLYNKQVLTNAAREGARAAITTDTPTTPQNIIQSYCNTRLIDLVNGSASLSPSNSTITIRPVGGQYMEVSISFNYQYLFSSLLGLNQTTLTGSTTMRLEQLPAAAGS